jgi:hypothetical protein
MRACKRILAALALLLGAAGLLLSLAVGVGVWVAKEPVTARAKHLSERVDAGLDLAEQKLDRARTSLASAAERLENVQEERRQLSRESRPGDFARMAVARTVQRTLAPELNHAQKDLHAVAEAAVVVNSVLEDVANVPFLSETGLDMDTLAEINGRVASVGPAAWELSRLLGEADPGRRPDVPGRTAPDQAAGVGRPLPKPGATSPPADDGVEGQGVRLDHAGRHHRVVGQFLDRPVTTVHHVPRLVVDQAAGPQPVGQ